MSWILSHSVRLLRPGNGSLEVDVGCFYEKSGSRRSLRLVDGSLHRRVIAGNAGEGRLCETEQSLQASRREDLPSQAGYFSGECGVGVGQNRRRYSDEEPVGGERTG